MKKLTMILIAAILWSCSDTNRMEWKQMLKENDLKLWALLQNPENFSLKDGILTCKGEKGLMLFKGEDAQPFKNFAFKAEVKTREGAQAAFLFHAPMKGKDIPGASYEVALNNTYKGMKGYPDIKMTGSLKRIRNVYVPTAENGQWTPVRINVQENRIRIFVDGQQVVDYIEPKNPWRPEALALRTLSGGYTGIHCKGDGSLQFRNMQIKALEAENRFDLKVSKEYDAQITKLHAANYPMVDLHTHLKDGLTIEEALEKSRKYGINYGIAANCGLKFPITNNQQLYDYIQSLRDYPVFVAMQAEGREWVDIFAPDTVAMADYVFTDAMTWTNKKGQRMRLWIPEETHVGDPQDFMEQLTDQIVGVTREPIDIYVNPTYLPEEIQPQYEALWTQKRINKVVQALKKHEVALEINNRYELPSRRILTAAKEAGVKFAMGTNNVTKSIGKPEYTLRMIRELNLHPSDFWLPEP